MVVLTSRVALIAASISLAAISNVPTVDGVAIPTTPRSDVVARHAPVVKEGPVLNQPQTIVKSKGKSNEKEQTKKKDKRPKTVEESHPHGRDANDNVLKYRSEVLSMKRSPKQKFFHARRGPWAQPEHGLGPYRRRSSSHRVPPRGFIKARDEDNVPPGYIALEGLQTGKKYGSLVFNPSNGDIDALDASDKVMNWNYIAVPCPPDFQKCASFAMVDTSDRNRCITFTSSSTEPSRLHGDYCWGGSMAVEEAANNRSQTFGYDSLTGRIQPLPSDSRSSTNSSVVPRESGEEVTMVFHPLEPKSSIKQSNVDSSNSDSTPLSSESTGTGTSTETTTVTITVTAESEPTTSPADLGKTSTASTAMSSPTQASTPLKVKVFEDTPSSTTGSVSVTSSAASTTSATAQATTTTPGSSVDGNAVASGIVAEYSSSSLAPTTTMDASSTSMSVTRR